MEREIQCDEKKLHESITNLMNVRISTYEASAHYYARIINSLIFEFCVVNLTEQQEIKLIKICKEPLLIKMGLSRNFPPGSILCKEKHTRNRNNAARNNIRYDKI